MMTTLWGPSISVVFVLVFGGLFYVGIFKGAVKSLGGFKRWTLWTATFAAVLVVAASIPVDLVCKTCRSYTKSSLKDIASIGNIIGPLLLSVSTALASVFYSAGEWYDLVQRFKKLGILDATPNRQGRYSEKTKYYQDILSSANKRFWICGVTLGGWFIDREWRETKENLLIILARGSEVKVILAHPQGHGFQSRAKDPTEKADAEQTQTALTRAKSVYLRIKSVLEEPEFASYIKQGKLQFLTYHMAAVSVILSNNTIYFTPYLPYVSDRDCPEYKIDASGEMGLGIAQAVRDLVSHATVIATPDEAKELADKCAP